VTVVEYHDRTKHHVHRFARSLGYLDWASQPDPFRRYAGAEVLPLPQVPVARDLPFSGLFGPPGLATSGDALPGPAPLPAPVTPDTIGEFLRCALGLSAWKQAGATQWALRVNPSSGNLHPTEGYVVAPPGALAPEAGVYHYAPREHALERRTSLPASVFPTTAGGPPDAFLVGLSSIHWREAWKYGERAWRYCQHDVGHAVGALRMAAALLGWRLVLLPRWSDADVSALLGLEQSRGEDAEAEAPDCVAVVGGGDLTAWWQLDPAALAGAARAATWHGQANRLSASHAPWPAVEEVAEAAAFPGVRPAGGLPEGVLPAGIVPAGVSGLPERAGHGATEQAPASGMPDPPARQILLQRRSAVAFDGAGRLSRASFDRMLGRLRPSAPPWDALWWGSQAHLILFLHRVDGVLPGVYAYVREPGAVDSLRVSLRPDFLWEAVPGTDGLYLLAPFDCRGIARRLSCDQAIASDGFLAAAMLVPLPAALQERGPWAYRHLFWECGLLGQVLYLEAEAAGGRATGIGCYFDDAVHDLLGITDGSWQSLYHFSMGVPVDDGRLLTLPGYDWEARAQPGGP